MDRYEYLQHAMLKIADLGPSAYAFISCIAFHADENGVLSPGYDELCGALGMSTQTVSTAIKLAVAHGFITIKKNFKSFTQFSISLKFKGLEDTTLSFNRLNSIKEDIVVNSNSSLFRGLEEWKEPEPEPTDEEVTPYREMSIAFEGATRIPLSAPDKWSKAIHEMLSAGVTIEDMTSAIAILREKNYSILGPWSVKNTAIAEMSKRAAPAQQKRSRAPAPDEAPAGFQLWHAGDPL